MDSVSLAALREPLAVTDTTPLAPAELANLERFARLLSYVRFFHPSDQAADADWDNVAVDGVRRVAGARDRADFIQELRDVFYPLGPSIRIYAGGSRGMNMRPAAAEHALHQETITWEHRGIQLDDPAWYRSQRIVTNIEAVAHPLVVDLGGGVTAIIPLAVYRGPRGTMPRPDTAASRRRASGIFVASDRSVRLADVILSWSVLHTFYPYGDVEKIDWHGLLVSSLSAAAAAPDAAALERVLAAFTAATHDGHGLVYQRLDARLLPLTWDWIEGKLVITSVTVGSAELAPGDIVDKIDGVPAAEAIADITSRVSGSTDAFRREMALTFLSQRHNEKPIRIDAHNSDGGAKSVLLTPSADPARFAHEAQLARMSQLEAGIWYVDLGRIGLDDVKPLLAALVDAKGVVFDLRAYPTESGFNLLAHFASRPLPPPEYDIPVTTRPDATAYQPVEGGPMSPLTPTITAKMAFLVGPRTVSAGETLSDIIQHYRVGILVGETTAGENGAANEFVLPGGFHVQFTGMRAHRYDGSLLHGVGIRPDVFATRTIAGATAGRDEILACGLAVLRADAPNGSRADFAHNCEPSNK